MEKLLNKGILITLVFFLLGAIVSGYQNRLGTAIPTGDSGSNLISAQSILQTSKHGWPTYSLSSDGSLSIKSVEKNTVWPPLTAILVAALQYIGISQYWSVFAFTVFFSGLTLSLTFFFARMVLRSNIQAFGFTLFFFSLWGYQYWISKSYMPEGLYISTTLLISLVLSKVLLLKRQRILYYLLIGLFSSVSYYIKSAAPAFILSLLLSVFIFNYRHGLKYSLIRSSSMLLGVVLGIAPWLFRNISIGTIGGSGAAGEAPVVQSIVSLLRLFVPYHGQYLSSKITIICLGIVLLFSALLFVQVFKSFKTNWFEKLHSRLVSNSIELISVSYLVSFMGVIFIAIFIIPKASHIETRYWLEVLPFMGPVVVCWFRDISVKLNIPKRLQSISIAIILLTMVGVNIQETNRNFNKTWTILKMDDEQQKLRSEITKLVPGDEIYYSSNFGNELFAQFGLSYWSTWESGPQDAVNLYISYESTNHDIMTLGNIESAPPKSWEYIGDVNGFKIYQDKQEK